MNIQGEHWLPSSPQVVWDSLHDGETLRATIPGCKELTKTGPNVFTGAASVGIGAIKGLYRGSLELTEEQPYSGAQIRIETRSGHAEIRGTGSVRLEESDGGTLVKYEGEAHISGMLAAVGQRLLPSATKSLIEHFLKNVEQELTRRSEEVS
jgi:carbon monoxide dehydrogenase subunit G